ncbi:MAG: hypothetical protein WC326_13000 [Candidatus Delongbacteria bacterium]
MTFTQAVAASPDIASAYQRGLGALKAVDRAHITVNKSTKLKGSVDIDSTLQSKCPTEHRWDYGIGKSQGGKKGDKVIWVEIHPAKDGEINTMMDKLAWLKSWLQTSATDLDALSREFIWISSGKTTITQGSPAARKMALAGLRLAGHHLHL